MPPSAHPHLKPMTARRVDVKSHKRGAPNGHNGTTKPRKIPDEIRHITGQECPGCNSNDIRVIGQKHQQQEEMPPEIQPLVVDVVRDVCRCNKCKLKFLARDGMIPEDNMLL